MTHTLADHLGRALGGLADLLASQLAGLLVSALAGGPGERRVALDIAALYQEHAPAIHGYLRRRLPHTCPTVADDLTSTVFEKAIRRAATYQDRGQPPLVWLYAIAHNALIDHVRRQRQTVELTDIQVRAAVADAGAEHQHAALDMQAALRHLQPAQRAVIVERFFHGRSVRQTARAVGNTEDAVKKLQMRALANLRIVLGGYDQLQAAS